MLSLCPPAFRHFEFSVLTFHPQLQCTSEVAFPEFDLISCHFISSDLSHPHSWRFDNILLSVKIASFSPLCFPLSPFTPRGVPFPESQSDFKFYMWQVSKSTNPYGDPASHLDRSKTKRYFSKSGIVFKYLSPKWKLKNHLMVPDIELLCFA